MSLTRKSLILFVLMCIASALAIVLKPTLRVADERPPVDLATLIPEHFGEWREEKQNVAFVVNPQQQAVLSKIYNQTLARTYVNGAGYRVMVSLAYGGDQSDAMQLHKPEVCYPAQGFELLNKADGTLGSGSGAIPITRIVTRLGQRREPVTYWTTVGNEVVRGGVQKKLTEMSYGLKGKIPDGMLVRLSSIDASSANAFKIHEQFAIAMLSAVVPERRHQLGISGLSR